MAPTPQEHVASEVLTSSELDENSIVISGMSGLYPQSHNVKEFSDILYNKVNPITPDGLRFTYNHPEVVQYSGCVPDLNRFDAQFFKINYRFSNAMDSMSRKLLEQAYQAIYDAGVNPEELSGRKVGVYVGTSFSEADKICMYDSSSMTGFGIAGCNKSMFANRISYWLNARGPSHSIETACCSSGAALEQAYLALMHGQCDAAIVGGAYLCLHPQSSVHYNRIIKMCQDGKTKSFDENADGCAKSEAINVLFLQRAKDALRVYAHVKHAKTEFIFRGDSKTPQKLGYYRNLDDNTDFIKQFYVEAGVSPQNVEYVEAFGSALPEADKIELQTIEHIFCNNRNDPLLVGSVMSNIGYGEAASVISGVTKVLLGYHNGKLAANLHCTTPRKDIVSLADGRMQIVTDHADFGRTFVAVNNMSVTGVNSHILLHGCYKPKDLSRYKTTLPYLVNLSGRHEEAVNYFFGELKSSPIDPEQIALIHNIHKVPISAHLSRGFTILQTKDDKTVSLCEEVNYFDTLRKPLWFVYSGMGSQWAGMGAKLMNIPIFAAAIERCRQALEPLGLDIVEIITSPDETTFNNILHSFVGIAAIQIGLTDILREIGLKPDGIIGHSVGELGCAYADGCLTAEEMILSAYYRGLVSLETKFIHGSMAAVGLGYDQISKLIPPEIAVACHNAPESSTISGPSDVMKEFVATLTSKGIFAKEVPCSNIAYHSCYIADAGPGLLKYLKQVIQTPKARSERWLSTSVAKVRWEEPIAKHCSAEYLTNNLLSPVLFEETSRLIPHDAVLVEIAPHGLLQAILKRSMPVKCKNIPLTRRKHPDSTIFLLEAIGKLYMEGFNPDIQVLYPKVQMPVSTGTPFLSNLIKWVHDEKWGLPLYRVAVRKTAASCDFILTLHDKEHSYLRGNLIRGYTLFPYAASLELVWDTLTMIQGSPRKELSVFFKNVQLFAQPILHDRRQLKLVVSIQREGKFEVLVGSSIIAKGLVYPAVTGAKPEPFTSTKEMYFTAEDIHQMHLDRDCNYSGDFKTIECADESLSEATFVWRKNWTTLLDGVLQLAALRQPQGAVIQPSSIRFLKIDVDEHAHVIANSKVSNDNVLLNCQADGLADSFRCGGVFVESVKFEQIPPMEDPKIGLRSILEDDSFAKVKEGSQKSENVTLMIEKIGHYDSLRWVQALKLSGEGIKVNVQYAGINVKDMKQASGALNCSDNVNNSYGMDFSGYTDSGKAVMGVVRSGAASTQVMVQPELVWPVPAHWSLQDAATVPLAYVQAFYLLGIKSPLFPNYSILVHGGAGALGQAIISIALAHNCEVYTTVGDIRKKQFLLRLFPALKADHIGCSRDHTFGDMIQIGRRKNKCHIVISGLTGHLKDISLDCAHISGVCLDISQIQNRDDFNFGMNHLENERNYYPINFESMFEDKDSLKEIQKMVCKGIAEGYVQPLTHVTYAPNEVPRAFHILAASSHRGRVLVNVKQDNLETQFRLACNQDNSYLIIANNTAFGVHLADRLIARGATKIHLHVQKSLPYVQHKIRYWRQLGVKIVPTYGLLNRHEAVGPLVNNALSLGPLEGVFVSVGEANDEVDRNLISTLDVEIQKRCSDLRYFTVVNFGKSSIGKDVCVNRLRKQLPAVEIMMNELRDELKKNFSYQCAVNAVERVLQINNGRFVANVEPETKPSLLEEIVKFIGMTIPDDVSKDRTLEELGLKYHKLAPLSNFLRIQYNLVFNEDQLRDLTINDILEVEKAVKNFEPQETKGLSTFFNYIDSDELLATTDIVFLPTLVSTNNMRDDEYDAGQQYLCIVPGVEGLHKRFRTLCERLKLAALVLQPGLDNPNATVKELAKNYAEVLLKKVKMQDTFYLLGYESGIFVALEIAAILESHGLIGKVICVGCTPDEFTKEVNDQLAVYKSEEELQDGVLRHIYTLVTGCDASELDQALQNLNTWPKKIEACVRKLLGRVSHSVQYAHSLIECALLRIQHARNFSASVQPLRSQIIVLRAAIGQRDFKNTILTKISKDVVVHQLDSSLAHITDDLRCTAIINDHLEPKILEDFVNRNICNTYLQNAESYINMEYN